MGKGKRAHTISTPSISLPRRPSVADLPFGISFGTSSSSSSHKQLSGNHHHTTLLPPRRWTPSDPPKRHSDLAYDPPAPSLFITFWTYYIYFIVSALGFMRDCVGKVFKPKEYAHLGINEVQIGGMGWLWEATNSWVFHKGVRAISVRFR